MVASERGHEVVVETLLKAGATVDMQDEVYSILTFYHVVYFLYGNCSLTSLKLAHYNGSVIECVIVISLPLPEWAAVVDLPLQNGDTALMVASAKGHEVVVEALLKAGATEDMQAKVLLLLKVHQLFSFEVP